MFRTFIDRVLSGDVLDVQEEVDDAIDQWHNSDTTLELHEWLGMNPFEYELFVSQHATIELILNARHYNRPIEDVILQFTKTNQNEMRLAARMQSETSKRELQAWLERTGRIPPR